MNPPRYVRWFKDLRSEDVASVGGKNAALGELYSALSSRNVRVPNGFALTADFYRNALTTANAWFRLQTELVAVQHDDVKRLAIAAANARAIRIRGNRYRRAARLDYGELPGT